LDRVAVNLVDLPIVLRFFAPNGAHVCIKLRLRSLDIAGIVLFDLLSFRFSRIRKQLEFIYVSQTNQEVASTSFCLGGNTDENCY